VDSSRGFAFPKQRISLCIVKSEYWSCYVVRIRFSSADTLKWERSGVKWVFPEYSIPIHLFKKSLHASTQDASLYIQKPKVGPYPKAIQSSSNLFPRTPFILISFPKEKVGWWDHYGVCVSPRVNFWTPWLSRNLVRTLYRCRPYQRHVFHFHIVTSTAVAMKWKNIQTAVSSQRIGKHAHNNEELLETVFFVGSAPRLYKEAPRPAEDGDPCGGGVEYLYSTANLRVVGGDEKGSVKSETVKYGRESQGTRTLERLHWQGPVAYIKDRLVISSEKAPHKIKTITIKQ
jgi:hypothetical protein